MPRHHSDGPRSVASIHQSTVRCDASAGGIQDGGITSYAIVTQSPPVGTMPQPDASVRFSAAAVTVTGHPLHRFVTTVVTNRLQRSPSPRRQAGTGARA